ncbi:MAG: hypothetical protein ACRD2W_05395 [Acidimicrobiales bacterium]
MTPSSNDAVTIPCPVCVAPFEPIGKRRYCRDACRVAAHRRRHRAPNAPEVLPPPGQPRRSQTVYECPSCDERALGEQRCGDCNTFMRSLGPGGLSPCCGDPVTVEELLNP